MIDMGKNEDLALLEAMIGFQRISDSIDESYKDLYSIKDYQEFLFSIQELSQETLTKIAKRVQGE